MDPKVSIWGVDRIDCSSWFKAGDSAVVYGSNWAGDSCTFELYKLAENEIAIVNSQLSMMSPDWWESMDPSDIESTLSQEAQRKLDTWVTEIHKIISWLPEGQWSRGPGNSSDLEYAVLAFLQVTLGEFGGRRSNATISNLLSVPMSTAIERVRESRERGFLSAPGKGIRGQSILTARARKLLTEKGVMSA